MDMGEIAANIKEGDIILVWNKNEIFLICTKTYICIYILNVFLSGKQEAASEVEIQF